MNSLSNFLKIQRIIKIIWAFNSLSWERKPAHNKIIVYKMVSILYVLMNCSTLKAKQIQDQRLQLEEQTIWRWETVHPSTSCYQPQLFAPTQHKGGEMLIEELFFHVLLWTPAVSLVNFGSSRTHTHIPKQIKWKLHLYSVLSRSHFVPGSVTIQFPGISEKF